MSLQAWTLAALSRAKTAPALALALWAGATAALPLETTKGVVATADPLASEAGARMLRQGGNAVDAAVAAAFALAVVEPWSSGLGGGGFLLVWDATAKQAYALDFRETAPAAATPALFLRDGKYDPQLSRSGGTSVAVPGAVQGYAEAARRWGKLPLAKLVQPALELAAKGFAVGQQYEFLSTKLAAQLGPEAAKAFGPRHNGEKLTQPALARTLRAIAAHGPDAFTHGAIAADLVAAAGASGGTLSLEDLAAEKPRARTPLFGVYRGHRVATFPLPSAGGFALLELLAVAELAGPAKPWRDVDALHLQLEAEKRVYAERAAYLGDPAFSNFDPLTLLSPEHARALFASIDPAHATPAAAIAKATPPREKAETTHVCAVDAEGNAASLTTTINGAWGSGVYAAKSGVLLNDELDDFAAPEGGNLFGLVGGAANQLAPGKIPLSTMTPTLLVDAGRVLACVGSPGGSTIATTVAQVVQHLVDDGMRVDQALAAGRVHDQLFPDEVQVEPRALEPATRDALVARGHTVGAPSREWGNAQAIVVGADGVRRCASDPRGDGACAPQ